MNIKELRKKSNIELQKILKDKKTQVVNLKVNIASGNVKNVRELREAKKDIARLYSLEIERNNESN